MARNDVSRGRTAFATVLACCLLAGMFVPAPALAGDSMTIFYFDSDEIEADPGETIAVDLVVSDHGDYNANGIDELSFELEYDADVFTVTDVEHRSMLAAGNSDAAVDGSDEVDDEAGTVTVEQEREPSGDGARATEPAVTFTIEVDDDASPTTETLEIADASAILVTDYPQSVIERDATVYVDGGDETADSSAEESDSTDGPDGVTLADDPSGDESDEESDAPEPTTDGSDEAATATENGSDEPDDASAESETESESTVDDGGGDAQTDDSVPGFGIPISVVGIVAALYRRL